MAVCVLIVFYMAMSIVLTQMCGSKKKKPAAGAKSEVPMSAIDATGAAAKSSTSQVKKPDEEKKEEEKKEEEKKEE
ncbi:hypothetical protein GCK72_015164 [Caenorhabditis remanei]|uniref:Uncharacterized protein n=1 Tax=Caenorhabditis remanei TaxID=31234 RepID=A0A6A5GVM1_CAERE|nr:hypothetical protein GCK72_015164 [Caenorhabditis remanei]KAF1758704.1 hypothetical protein GCK72_015164 [Caenorhabditis remanei]